MSKDNKEQAKKFDAKDSKEARLKIAEERSSAKNEKKEDLDSRSQFRLYFNKIKAGAKLESDMEDILWLHLKATHNDLPENFGNGIENFGYKLSR